MSYTKCVYHECKNTSESISMFRFPVNDRERLERWIRNSGNHLLDSLTNEELRCRYICAAHFLPSHISKGPVKSRLLGPAVPIHFQCADICEGSVQKESSDADKEIDVPPSPDVLKVKTPSKFYRKRARTSSVERQISNSSSSLSLMGDLPMVTPTKRLSRKCLYEGPKKRMSRKCLFQENNADTPRTKRLKQEACSLLRKNKAQRVQVFRLRAKSKVENKIDMRDFPSAASKTLALMQLRKGNDKKKWTKEERDFCLSLYYKSPSTYYFMRRQGIVLAAPSTIRSWLAKTECSPGLANDTLKKIEKRFENANIREKSCVICFDEMTIMSNLEYSKKYDMIEGFEDLGGNRRTNKLAKSTLVFIIRGLFDKWQLPITYFLSNTNISAEVLKVLIKTIINKLFDHGLLPKAITCDQATTNQKAFKLLGVTSTSPFFFVGGRKVFAIFDVPHILKNIRNNFLKHNFICDELGEMSFQDVIKTYELDKKSTKSRSLPKLTDRHINPNSFEKMKVSLASQIFSLSVAAAIRTAKSTNELPSETAEATANLIETVNNMFDALNSGNRYNKNVYRHALSTDSNFARQAIEDGKRLFKKMQKLVYKKYKSGQIKKVFTRPPCFDGVVQSCEAILQLFVEETTEPTIKYLMTKKLNQDVVENYFARIRQKGGANRNPTAKLLRTIFRSNLINSLIKLPGTKNCEDDFNDHYVDISAELPSTSGHGGQEQINVLLLNTEQTASGDTSIAATTIYKKTKNIKVNEPLKKKSLEECSLVYFAGYLAKSCLAKFDCAMCNVNLIKEYDLDDEKQLLILNKSYNKKCIKLKSPSDNLIQLIDVALECFNLHFHGMVHYTEIKKRLFKCINDYLRCEAQHLLKISCESHLFYIIDKMILVKINYYCKNYKNKSNLGSKMHPKLKILKNK